ncbi:hypothetical protein ACUSIJ_01345 [Pseudochelatococcus sp. B33]
MMTPTRVAELITRTAARSDIDERPGLAILQAALSDADIRNQWLALRRTPPAFIVSVTITEAGSDTPLEEDEPVSDIRFRIVVETVAVDGELRLFLGRSLANAVAELPHVGCVQIADMGEDQTFASFRSRFQLWSGEPAEPYAPSEPLPDPRSLSTDFTRQHLVPDDLRPWLQRDAPRGRGPAYEAWTRLSGPRLLAALANRVSELPQGVGYHFSGPPSRVISPSVEEILTVFGHLNEGAKWVFTEGRDTDTRHLLFAHELARSHRSSVFDHFGGGSLESAKNAYAAYVKASSRETLKALAELRKAVIDEAQKTSQKAQDLATGLWKDAAVAAVPFVLKLLPDTARAQNRYIAGAMAVAAALLVAFSYGTQIFINRKFFRNQDAARRVWRQALNVVLTPSEIEEFSEQPIRNSIADYHTVRFWAGLVYGALILILVLFAVYNFRPDLFGVTV